jgi:hypothetical protein
MSERCDMKAIVIIWNKNFFWEFHGEEEAAADEPVAKCK